MSVRGWWIFPVLLACRSGSPAEAQPAPSASVSVAAAPVSSAPLVLLGRPDGALPEGRVQARHIVIGFRGAKQSKQTRTREEARARAEEVLAKLRAGGDFAALASEYSEDPTAVRGGDLGVFARTDLVAPLADAAFALAVSELSALVETEQGFHVVQRVR